MIVNTSFNVRGEPIVNTIEDAFNCFMGTGLDKLVIGNCYLDKNNQNQYSKYTIQLQIIKNIMNFLKKILAPGCLIISLCLLIYTFYRSEIYWNGEKSVYYLSYYIFSIIIFLFSIFAFFLNQNIKKSVIISLISIK